MMQDKNKSNNLGLALANYIWKETPLFTLFMEPLVFNQK